MVRTDHEDGGVLKPSDDDERKPQIERSSPLSRRRKPTRRGRTPDTETTSETDERLQADPPVETDEAERRDEPADRDETVTLSADDRSRGVTYRERRPSVKAPVGSGRSMGSTVLLAVTGSLGFLLLVVSIVVAVVFTTASARIDDDRELRAGYDQFAQEVVVKLTTLNKDNADDMLEFMNKHTSGRALQEMRESMKQATDLIREDDMKTKTTVVASAVEKADEDTGSVLVVFVWESTAPEAPDKPVVETFRSRIDITRINGDLKLTNYEWVG